ncbi:hypothetical protein TL16_g13281 [Triparma laevis f. inornata]|uniref:Uncharacterized protein n=1 Tax=Triparma laevis f. inornata TaxID=1714386 RepID=A0A9W7BTG4_9STRA|nr:hypothetical protein TL16_g13281 [Triparma laevis f. inornata]
MAGCRLCLSRGKTTAAIALVMDKGIHKHLTKLLFISVGQEPEMRDLQNELFNTIAARGFILEILVDFRFLITQR